MENNGLFDSQFNLGSKGSGNKPRLGHTGFGAKGNNQNKVKHHDYIPLVVEEVKKSMETKKMFHTVSFDKGGETHEATFTYADMYQVLAECGHDMCRTDERAIKESVEQQIKDKGIGITNTYEQLGWCCLDGELAHKGNTLLSNSLTAVYDGKYDLEPKGCRESMVERLKTVICPYIALLFAFISGLVANTIGFLKRCGVDVPTVLLNICGQSTTGKTTAARLIVSVGSNPFHTDGKDCLLSTCNTTASALLETVREIYGFPVAFDELGALDDKINMRPILYALANGKDKGRYGQIKSEWSSLVAFTGEFSLLELTDKTDGILIRVFNLPNISWVCSDEQAAEVNAFCKDFSGLPLDMYARTLFDMDKDEVIKYYNSLVKKTSDKLPLQGAYKSRAAKVVAAYKLTAAIAEKTFNVDMHRKEIGDFLLQSLTNTAQELEREDIYESFMGYITVNSCYFHNDPPTDYCISSTIRGQEVYTSDLVKKPQTKVYGYFDYKYYAEDKKLIQYVIIVKDIFDSWFRDRFGAHEDIEKVLSKWAEQDILVKSESDRYCFRIRDKKHVSLLQVSDSGAYVNCYKIRCNHPIGVTFTDENPVGAAKPLPKGTVTTKTVEEMLSDNDESSSDSSPDDK